MCLTFLTKDLEHYDSNLLQVVILELLAVEDDEADVKCSKLEFSQTEVLIFDHMLYPRFRFCYNLG